VSLDDGREGGPSSQSLRLLHVLYSGQGGLGTYFLEFVASDKNRRFAHSAVFYGIEQLHPEYERFVRERDIPFTTVRKRRGPDLVSAIRLLGAMSQPADAIVLHTGAGASAIGALLRSAITSCPLIQVEHTTSEVKTARDRFWTFLLRHSSDRTVTFYPEHREEFASGAARCVLIPKRADVSFFRPSKRRSEGDIRIGMQGRLSVHKDHSTLLRAFAIATKRSVFPLSLHVAGGGNERERLERLASDLGISSSVTFYGMLERSELRSMLQSLDIYVHATHGETMCFAIMEAQACGLPVIGSEVPGVRDAIKEGSTGLLFPHEDVHALARLLQRLSNAPELRERLGQGARADVVSKANQQPTAEAYYDTVLDILAERRTARGANR
jgi:glycosyltransferase involved in cell wall biosynthesis